MESTMSRVLCLLEADNEGNSGVTMPMNLDPEDYEEIAAAVVRTAIEAGARLQGILTAVGHVTARPAKEVPEPLVIG